MSKMKMSDVFSGKVAQDGDTILADGYGELADFSGYKREARYAAHAINNHDRMVEEIAELRSFAKKVSELDIETFHFETQGGDEDCFEYACTDIVYDAIELLAKLNQEGEE